MFCVSGFGVGHQRDTKTKGKCSCNDMVVVDVLYLLVGFFI